MKKIKAVFFILLVSINLVGCNNVSFQTNNNSAPAEKTVRESSPQTCTVPEQFKSEEDFLKGLKDGRVYSQYHPEEIKYYYRPKTLPEGAEFLYMEANYDYVMIFYTFDKTNPGDLSKQIMYKTYRGYTADDYTRYLIDHGFIEYNLEGKASGSRYFSYIDFNTAKKGFNSLNGKEDYSNEAPPAWTFFFIQNGDCFAGSVSFNIDEKDITKYFDMEKVTIK